MVPGERAIRFAAAGIMLVLLILSELFPGSTLDRWSYSLAARAVGIVAIVVLLVIKFPANRP